MATIVRMILTLTLLLNSVQLLPDTLTIPKVGFVVRYDTHLGVPVMTDYVLPRSMLRRVTSRKGIDFYPDMALPAPQVRPSCYNHSGYDRGHNVPAADKAGNAVQMIETFSMANISPQTPRFNRHDWKKVEILVRSLARRYGSIRVVTIPIFVYPDTLWLPCRHVAVPDGFRKKVYCWPTNRLILDTILWQRRKPQEGFVTTTP
jgi:endonuclease G